MSLPFLCIHFSKIFKILPDRDKILRRQNYKNTQCSRNTLRRHDMKLRYVSSKNLSRLRSAWVNMKPLLVHTHTSQSRTTPRQVITTTTSPNVNKQRHFMWNNNRCLLIWHLIKIIAMSNLRQVSLSVRVEYGTTEIIKLSFIRTEEHRRSIRPNRKSSRLPSSTASPPQTACYQESCH